jgi:hypothetical protein
MLIFIIINLFVMKIQKYDISYNEIILNLPQWQGFRYI